MHPFEAYVKEQHIEPLLLSLEAQVRYLTIWNATKGNPIVPEQAQRIRQAVFRMTRVAYTGSFVLTHPEAIEDMPTLPIKKIPRSHF
jgi:hypothetical protein